MGLATMSAIITAISTLYIAIMASFQLVLYRKEEKRNRTLEICLKYDLDPILSKIVKKLRENEELNDSEAYTILNYFDVLAIGGEEGSYAWDIVFSQFKNIIPSQTDKILKSEWKDDYPDLRKLVQKIESDKQESAGFQTKKLMSFMPKFGA
jgi:hypothetical protein